MEELLNVAQAVAIRIRTQGLRSGTENTIAHARPPGRSVP